MPVMIQVIFFNSQKFIHTAKSQKLYILPKYYLIIFLMFSLIFFFHTKKNTTQKKDIFYSQVYNSKNAQTKEEKKI